MMKDTAEKRRMALTGKTHSASTKEALAQNARNQWQDSRDKVLSGIHRFHDAEMEKRFTGLSVIIEKDGKVEYIPRSQLNYFCKEHGIIPGNAKKVITGKLRHSGGYTFREVADTSN